MENSGRIKKGTDSRIIKEAAPSRKIREAERDTLGFVYKWTNLINGRWAIGSHKGDPEDTKDKYITSTSALLQAMRKYGVENFKRDILYYGLGFRDKEEELLTQLNAADDPQSYNIKNQSWGGTFLGKDNGMFGKSMPPEVIIQRTKTLRETLKRDQKLREQQRERMEGEKNPMWNQTHTPEVREKIAMTKALKKEGFSHIPGSSKIRKTLRNIYSMLAKKGNEVSPRGLKVIEIENFRYDIPPYVRFHHFVSRKLNVDYIKKEFLWYLGGDLFDLSICDHARIWKDIVSNTGHLNSNYGHYYFTNKGIRWVVEELTRDKDSRRASSTILNSDHLNSENKDVPCNYAMNFRIRDNELKMTVHGRSQDAIYGMGVDTPCFSFMHEMTYELLKLVYPDLKYGTYTHLVDSFHVYEKHFEMLKKLTAKHGDPLRVVLCPKILNAEEVEFLLSKKGKHTLLDTPENFMFSRWLLMTEEEWRLELQKHGVYYGATSIT